MTARLESTCGYWSLAAGIDSPEPALVQVELTFASDVTYTATLPSDKLTDRALCKALPQLRGVANRSQLIDGLNENHCRAITAGTLPHGVYFDTSGLHRLPDGALVYVWGEQLLGTCSAPYLIEPQRSCIPRAAHIEDALPRLCHELTFAAPQVMVAVTYLAVTLIRSWIREITPSWQAVLNIVGGQGLGKTTLARHLTDWLVDAEGTSALLFSAGGTPAAIRDAMIAARDLPLIIDDLCLSASPQLQRRYRDLGAQFVREGANEAAIVKKRPGGQTIRQKCRAGVILTAEFPLENASDITRCVFVNVDAPLNLPSTLSADLVGAAAQAFVKWFLAHEPQASATLSAALRQERDANVHPRVWYNFTLLNAVFQLLIHSARDDGLSGEAVERLCTQYSKAVSESIAYQTALLDKLNRSTKKGNLAAILLAGMREDAFNLTSKLKKLASREGIVWKRDLCLRRDALERFVRLQDGYGAYTLAQIVRELRDMGALVIQEEGTAQVKLRRDLPRVYRIRLDVLEKTKEEFS